MEVNKPKMIRGFFCNKTSSFPNVIDPNPEQQARIASQVRERIEKLGFNRTVAYFDSHPDQGIFFLVFFGIVDEKQHVEEHGKDVLLISKIEPSGADDKDVKKVVDTVLTPIAQEIWGKEATFASA